MYILNELCLTQNRITEKTQETIIDCIWEYKPFDSIKWYRFSDDECHKLRQSLIVKSDEEFKHEVFLKVRGGTYSVSTMNFLRSGQGNDKENNLAWVRCRGSSILNFDCYSVWQVMFIKHTLSQSESSISSLKVFNIPTIHNSQFRVQKNAWYKCSHKTNVHLDKAMDYRRKHVTLELDFLSPDRLTFNLEKFSFSNENSTITGFIRWTPKLRSNNEQNKNKIEIIEDFSTSSNLNPTPLTTKHVKQVSQITDRRSSINEYSLDDDNDNDYLLQDIHNLDIDENDEDDQVDKVDTLYFYFFPQIYSP